MTKRLSDFPGRNDNFNLLRMIAALLVIEAHACATTGHRDLLKPIFGIGAGDLGVDIFFVLSGYLITKSLSGKTYAQFAWARIIRIYPALWASTVLSVLVVGLFFCRSAAISFLTQASTLSYVWHNATMLPHFGAQLSLPGAFGYSGNDFNVSLWTLPYELQMYMVLAVTAALIGTRPQYMAALALAGAGIAAAAYLHVGYATGLARGRLLYFFFSGALAFSLRDSILLSGRIAAALVAAIIVSLTIPNPVWRESVLALSLPYLVLWGAYIPAGPIRLWNRLGDYSYGSYIFAHPVQVGLAVLGLTTTWWSNMTLGVAIVLPLAALSWHVLEKRALALPIPALAAKRVPPPAPQKVANRSPL